MYVRNMGRAALFQFELPEVLFQLPPKTPQFQPLLALQPNNKKRKKAARDADNSPNYLWGTHFPKPLYRGFLRRGRAALLQYE